MQALWSLVMYVTHGNCLETKKEHSHESERSYDDRRKTLHVGDEPRRSRQNYVFAAKLASAEFRSEGRVGCATNRRIARTAFRATPVAGDARHELTDHPVPRRRLLCVATDMSSHQPPRLPVATQAGLARVTAGDRLVAKLAHRVHPSILQTPARSGGSWQASACSPGTVRGKRL